MAAMTSVLWLRDLAGRVEYRSHAAHALETADVPRARKQDQAHGSQCRYHDDLHRWLTFARLVCRRVLRSLARKPTARDEGHPDPAVWPAAVRLAAGPGTPMPMVA